MRYFLFAGTVPMSYFLFTGTVPMRYFLVTGTVPVNNLFPTINPVPNYNDDDLDCLHGDIV